MGVYSVCTSTTVTIPGENAKKALAALRAGIPDLGFMDSRNIEMCASLPEALTKLDFEFEVEDGDIRGLHFGGGKNDTSVFVLPILAPFIADGGRLVMEHDGEPEVWAFADGDFTHYCDEEFDEEDDEDDAELSAEAAEIFELLGDCKAGVRKLKAAVEAEGHIDFRGPGASTVTIALVDVMTGGDDGESPITRRKTPKKWMDQLERVLKHGPDLDIVNHYEDSALTLALADGRFDVADRLIDAGASVFLDGAANPFDLAASRSSRELLDYLEDKGYAFADHAAGALVRACAGRDGTEGKLDFVEFLVDDLGADVDAPSESAIWTVLAELRPGATPLMAAASADDPDTVGFLLERGANPKSTDSAGNTALHYASGETWYVNDGDRCWWAGRRNLQTVKRLATDGNAVNVRNQRGQTPYTLARDHNPEALRHFRELLEKAGAPVPIELSDSLNGEVRCVRDGQMGLVLNFKNGNLDGRQEFLSKTGSTFAIVHYKDGKGDGHYQCWHDNGELMFDARLKEGRWDGEVKLMARDGRVGQHLNYKDGRREGVQILYNDDGSKIIEAHYRNGLKHGPFFFRKPDGKVLVDEEFEKGMPKKATDQEKASGDDPLAGLFGALLGAMTGGLLAAEMAEDKLKPTDKLFFHRQDKVLALFEKMQDRVLEEA